MNKSLIILFVGSLLVSSGILISPWLPLCIILFTCILILFGIYAEKKRVTEILKEKIENKIWEMPVVIDCGDNSCGHSQELEFSLNTLEFTCENCKKINKIYISFTSIPQYE